MTSKVDLFQLDKIIKGTIKHLEEGKEQIFDIAESARQERTSLRDNLLKLKKDTLNVIEMVDKLEVKEKNARLHLMEASRDFERYSEEEIKNAYDHAHEIQLQLGLLRERESQLRIRRDQMELSLRRLHDTVEKAESLVSNLGTALNFLLSNLMGAGIKIEEIHQKQLFGMRVIKAQEEERRRVAREIHDGPAQSMANLVLRVEICEKLLSHNPEEVKNELVELKNLVKSSLQDVRKIIFDLRPMVLDDLGIVPALKRYISEVQENDKVSIKFYTMGNKQERFSSVLEIAIFRIIQEALNNIHKHARAKTAVIYLEQASAQINIRIKDDGCGFEPEQVMNANKSNNYGLLGVKERVELLEGEFKIISAPNKGTDIIVKLPIQQKSEEKL